MVRGLVSVLKEERPSHSAARDVSVVEQSVQQGQQRVPQADGRPHGRLRRQAEHEWLLGLGALAELAWLASRYTHTHTQPHKSLEEICKNPCKRTQTLL